MKNDYECVECGNVKSKVSKSSRVLLPCKDCSEVTSHEYLRESENKKNEQPKCKECNVDLAYPYEYCKNCHPETETV